MNTKRFALCLALIAASLSGCASKPYVNTDRFAATGIESGEAITIILGEYQECKDHVDGGCPASSLTENSEREFALCLSGAMGAAERDLKIIPAETFWLTAFPGIAFQDLPRSSEVLTVLLKDEGFRGRIAPLNLRYAIVLKVSTRESGRKTTFGASQGVWGIGRESIRASSISAEIMDLREARPSGRLSTRVRGQAGFAVPVILIIPLPPVPYSAMTETRACGSLGKAVANFVTGKDLSAILEATPSPTEGVQ